MSEALSPQIHPFEINSKTREPYLRLPPPLSHIVITPPRLSDAPSAYRHFNDPRIYRWVSSPPFPYLMEHANEWFQKSKGETDIVWKELIEADPHGPLKIVGACPVRAIREEKEDGEDIYLGDCGFARYRYDDVMDLEERAKLNAENEARPVGDPDIVWMIGDYIDPSHHGQGIMTAVIGTLMSKWAVPRMNARCVRPSAFEGNIGSVKTFQKNGFVLLKTVERGMHTMEKGEFPAEDRTLLVLEWKAA
ncbi:hypothetical protein BV25DRAFT_1820344 [Artomyces pyxidatus]|uniref:Uncharacterized protein n=1 Tax=Artomyces pyxidatus TaxID=48021 RepID=A0ACB8TDF5_9AGAM|nr:hypothetical protein BV25DRAFT_1820344 [Artomyces pyxidatus]